MYQLIEKNRRLLKLYCVTSRIIGWYLVLGGVFWFLVFVSGSTVRVERADMTIYAISSVLFDFVLPGLIAFGVAQFIRYLFVPESRAGCILRNADRLLYIYAVFLIIKTVCGYAWYVNVKFLDIARESEFSRLLFMQPFLLPSLAKVLILVGFAVIVRRVLPVIEESKTLV